MPDIETGDYTIILDDAQKSEMMLSCLKWRLEKLGYHDGVNCTVYTSNGRLVVEIG